VGKVILFKLRVGKVKATYGEIKEQGFFLISQFIWDLADPLFFLFKDQPTRNLIQLDYRIQKWDDKEFPIGSKFLSIKWGK
jgi:hypothetical protein